MAVIILEAPFDPWQQLADYSDKLRMHQGAIGATATFVGTMRDFNEDDDVVAMQLEHYPGMTEKHLQAICQQAQSHYGLLETLIIHRVGDIKPDEAIVLVAVWSSHRKEAFEACRMMMEDLKSKAPFWKKERLKDGSSRWVEKNTPGF